MIVTAWNTGTIHATSAASPIDSAAVRTINPVETSWRRALRPTTAAARPMIGCISGETTAPITRRVPRTPAVRESPIMAALP